MKYFIWFLMIPLYAQSKEKQNLPLVISLYNESTAVPFTRFFTVPIHPGLQVGTEFNYHDRLHSRLFETVNVSYFYHHYLTQGISLNTELGYEYRFRSGIALTGMIGIGIMQTYATEVEYAFTGTHYEIQNDKGNFRIDPSISFDLGYYLKNGNPNSPKIFIRYQSWIEYPYSPGFVPIMSHINFHLGFRFFIAHKKDLK